VSLPDISEPACSADRRTRVGQLYEAGVCVATKRKEISPNIEPELRLYKNIRLQEVKLSC